MRSNSPSLFTPSASSKTLGIIGHGITDIEIHFLQIKFTAIGVYVDVDVASHLQAWKGKTAAELFADDSFFDALLQAPVEKFIRVVVIKELKGSQYGLQLENAMSFVTDENKAYKINVENGDVSSMIKKWYLGGSSAVSSSTIASLAEGIAALLK
ncbi:hypothetical protein KI387_037607 [Taxus chinensis]|uniref:Chalcone-flavonone isomerase family protein n=1 Tax=Taxus chinensis TaxID=29808 RepID=A0AA38KXG8_TAXCH|nr:hypothetical protein KI387_037607 [Taxus chinensis]